MIRPRSTDGIAIAAPARRSVLLGAASASMLWPGVTRATDTGAATLKAATYKGQEQPLLQVAGVANTPYRVEYSEFASGNLIIEAMNAGAIDIGTWSEIPTVFAAQSGAAIRTIAIIKADVNLQVVLVPKDSAIAGIADLKGKRVGYVRATTCHYFLLKMLWQANLDFGDITAVNLSPSDGQAAFEAGAIDAWAIYGYSVEFAVAKGARILKTANGILSGNYHVGVRPEIIRDAKLKLMAADFLVRLRKACAWREANKQGWSKFVAPIIGVPQPLVLDSVVNESQPYLMSAVDDAAIASARDVADTFVKAGVFRRQIDVAPYFDTSFTAELTAA
jgi:sulfonate transport system substrate-binding protein